MRKWRNLVRTFLLILIAVLLLLLALTYILNQNAQTNALIKRSNEQTTHIQKLEADVSRLENNIAYEDKQIQALSHSKATVVIQDNKEETTQVKDTLPIFDVKTQVVTTLVLLGTFVKTLVPSF